MAQLLGVDRNRGGLVARLGIYHWLHRRAVVVGPRHVVPAGELGHVAVLPHVEVQPVVVVEPGGRAVAAGWRKRAQVRAGIARAQSTRHGAHDVDVRGRLDGTVTAEYPDDAGVLVTS